ncbi:hypothetical protein ACFVAG_10155 [Streptomyces sp. NPDC057644]|uniref:hypothetical protein n=1 Tax=Streptomyces sp. NPDC057644 TaxID=3346191 RepID=UPI003683454F
MAEPEPEGAVGEGAVAREAGEAEAVVPRRPAGVAAAVVAVGEEAVAVAGAPVSAGAAVEAAPAR